MSEIAVILLAAGLSTRMGQPKMLLPWGDTTVLEKSIDNFQRAGLNDIFVVVGENKHQVTKLLSLKSESSKVQTMINPQYANGEMIDSVKVGIESLTKNYSAVFIALGDQPQLSPLVISKMLIAFEKQSSQIIIPSYQNRRGHPWLVGSLFFQPIISLEKGETLRSFIQKNAEAIEYVEGDDSILKDLDTPLDYSREKP